MKLLILGATGRTGNAVIKRAVDAGHQVIAFGRRPAQGAHETLTGTFGDKAFAEAVSIADAVLSCLASSNSEPVCSQAADAVLRVNPNIRYLTVAGAGVDRPEDQKAMPDKIIGLVMRLTAGRMLADRQKEVDGLAGSQAKWTAFRPPRLVNGKSTGQWRFSFDRPAATWIDRTDLAAAMIEALDREDLIGKAPFVSNGR